MMPANCPRIWEAEASRDGRLSKGARASFEQHCASCAVCRQAAEELSTLAEEVRAAAPAVDELAARRLRQRLLRSANEWMAARVAAPPWRWKLVSALATALALGMLLHGLWQGNSAELDADLVTRAEPGAIWSQRPFDGSNEITLFDGVLSVEVHHSSLGGVKIGAPSGSHPRVIVRVPDGQILDLGTRFRIAVQHERTREIAVSEGAVLFQRPGLPDVQVERGATWRLQEALATADAAEPHADAGSAGSVGALGSAARARSLAPEPPLRGAGPAPRRSPKPAASSSAPPLRDSAGDAASNAEDAAYLQWISLLRAGRREAARAAGLDYLRRFPNAFRRAEVQAIVAPLETGSPSPELPQQQ